MTTTTAPDRAHDGAWAQPASHRLAYIDGVRAIAILAVIAFHARIPGFRGGFVGVDVFFVISGFLITSQIVTQMLAGRFSAFDFYARRILRIFPPLLLVTVVTVAVAPLFPLLPNESNQLAHSAAATAAMISNYYFSAGTGYFSSATEIKPLLHTWSLGVEEQYYLLAPAIMGLILALAARRKWNPERAVLIGGAAAIVVSYIALAILSHSDHRLAFFSIMTRSWQFATGGMLAILALKGRPAPKSLRSGLGIAGLLAIAAAVFLYTEHIEYPGIAAALLPTLGAFLLLASGIGNENAPLMRILASRPAVTIGLLSYSWYLWHWPLTEFARTLAVGQDSVWKDVAATSTALLLSIPTYLFLERPLKALRRPDVTRRHGDRIVAAGLACSAVVAVAALAASHSPAFNRTVRGIEPGLSARAVAECRPGTGLPPFAHVTPCVVGAPGDLPSVVFWGDSHALMLAPIADWSAQDAGRTAVVLGKTSCPPLQGVEVDFFVWRTCAVSNNEVLAWIAKQNAPSIAGLVLSARWMLYDGHDAPDGAADLPRLLWSGARGRQSDYESLLRSGLDDLITTLSAERRVLIVGPVPEFKRPVGDCLMRAQLNGQAPEACAMARADVERRRADVMRVLRSVAAKFSNTRLIDPIDVFCDRERCWPFGPKGPYYTDHDHIGPLGAEMLYRPFEQDFRWVYGAK